jgi:hypothetical protein
MPLELQKNEKGKEKKRGPTLWLMQSLPAVAGGSCNVKSPLIQPAIF